MYWMLTLLLLLALALPAFAVDGVLEINDARAQTGSLTPGDSPGYPVTIDRAGSYRLTGDLFVSGTNTTVVEITADDVTLDLNGFSIRCLFLFTPCAGNGTGVGVNGSGMKNVTIVNGTVRDMASAGISLGRNARVEGIRAIDNGGVGILTQESSLIKDSLASNNGGDGITLVGSSLVVGSVASGNTNDGIEANAGHCNLIDNIVVHNGGAGLRFTGRGGYRGNTIVSNQGGTVVGLATELGPNLCGASGIDANTTCP
jgi:hypothetical protein